MQSGSKENQRNQWLVLKQGRKRQGVPGERRTGVSVMLHHQRGEAETAGLGNESGIV